MRPNSRNRSRFNSTKIKENLATEPNADSEIESIRQVRIADSMSQTKRTSKEIEVLSFGMSKYE